MRCPQCGAEVVEKSVFCHKCGHRIGEPAVRGGPSALRGNGDASVPVDGERVIWEGSFSPKALYGTFIACLVLSIAIVVIGAIFFPPFLPLAILAAVLLWLWPMVNLGYRKMAVHYRLLPVRLIHERGILKRVTDRIEVIDIDDIMFEQGLIERLLGVGTLRITSSDHTHPKLVLPGIDDVAHVAALIDETRRAERNRRGVYIEST